MKKLIIRYITILGMILSGVWLGVDKTWEPITVLLFALAGFIASDILIINKITEHVYWTL